ncbi:tRNA guanosine(34) transglycosylase Tgt [Patescibacteria group bacterium]|nr:tRNA guanosine(34) transglycosylase Tgt [Patescibacteria group bacterium]
MNLFKLTKKSIKSLARAGVLQTAHGKIQTPFFMPIATRGSVKTLNSSEVKKIGAQIVLGNSYHLYLKPGLLIIKKSGGLRRFINWPGPILTDSGGFQVFSLDGKRQDSQPGGLVKVTDKGVEFKSVYDGSKHLFTPVSVIKMQKIFGSDIIMVLDQCVANPCARGKAQEAVERTLKWAEKSIEYKNSKLKTKRDKQIKNQKSKNLVFGSFNFGNLFAIVQGSLYKELRIHCARELVKLNFDGYAIGGLAVGESPEEMYKVLDYTVPELPEDKPRYLMGVGYPEQIVEAIRRGVDMFDCVIPTREARHGRLYYFNKSRKPTARPASPNQGELSAATFNTQSLFYQTINIKSAKFARDINPINPNSKIPELKEYSKAYLRHLFSVNEPLALRLATLNNLEFYINLMKEIRSAVKENKL